MKINKYRFKAFEPRCAPLRIHHRFSRPSRIREDISTRRCTCPSVLKGLPVGACIALISRRTALKYFRRMRALPEGPPRTVTLKRAEGNACLRDMQHKNPRSVVLSRRLAIPIAILFATNLGALAQSIPSGRIVGPRQSALLRTHHKSKGPSSPSLLTPLKPQTLEAPYRPFTPRQRVRWFTTNTMDPSNLVGGIFLSALGTAPNRPKEYGPHCRALWNRHDPRRYRECH